MYDSEEKKRTRTQTCHTLEPSAVLLRMKFCRPCAGKRNQLQAADKVGVGSSNNMSVHQMVIVSDSKEFSRCRPSLDVSFLTEVEVFSERPFRSI